MLLHVSVLSRWMLLRNGSLSSAKCFCTTIRPRPRISSTHRPSSVRQVVGIIGSSRFSTKPDTTKYDSAAFHPGKARGRDPTADIRLAILPLKPEVIAHPKTAAIISRVLQMRLQDLYSSFTHNPSLEVLRKSYAWSIHAADVTWTASTYQELENWLPSIFDNKLRSHEIATFLVGSILKSVDRIVDVLITLKTLPDDFEVRAACLYLTGFLYKHELSNNPALMMRFDEGVDTLRNSKTWPNYSLNPQHIRLLLWRSNREQKQKLIEKVKAKYPDLERDTALYLASFCVKEGLLDQAFEFIIQLPEVEFQKDDQELMQCLVQLLRHDMVDTAQNEPQFRYLTKLLQRGLVPTAEVYGQIIDAALRSGFPGVAWDIYRHTQSLDIVPPPTAFLALLRQSFNTQNTQGVHELMSTIHQHDLHKDRVLFMYTINMVRRVTHTHMNMTNAHGLAYILDLYDQLYFRQKLAKFGFVSPEEDQSEAVDPKTDPDDYVLAYTVWAYILCCKEPPEQLWLRICKLADGGDDSVIKCLEFDLIYKAFMWLYFKAGKETSKPLEILRYMLEKQFCTPTDRTWTVLISGYLRLGDLTRAKQVYDLALLHGFTLDRLCTEYYPSSLNFDDLESYSSEIFEEQEESSSAEIEPVPATVNA